jgi:hypothetical protein
MKHVRMQNNRIPKQIAAHQFSGKRSLGIPTKRWHEIVTGHMV